MNALPSPASECDIYALQVSGLPVVKSSSDMTLVGVVSKKDLDKPGATVADIMSKPPVAARPDNKVADAAALMLKHKVCLHGRSWRCAHAVGACDIGCARRQLYIRMLWFLVTRCQGKAGL